MPHPRYIQLEHTADIWIRVYGENLADLFVNAGFAFFDLVSDLSEVEEKESRTIFAEANDQELLLVAWLDELLYQFDVHRMIFKRFDVIELNQKKIVAKGYGERYDRNRHHLRNEIKAVTYHRLSVEKVGDHWEASVIFDI